MKKKMIVYLSSTSLSKGPKEEIWLKVSPLNKLLIMLPVLLTQIKARSN